MSPMHYRHADRKDAVLSVLSVDRWMLISEVQEAIDPVGPMEPFESLRYTLNTLVDEGVVERRLEERPKRWYYRLVAQLPDSEGQSDA